MLFIAVPVRSTASKDVAQGGQLAGNGGVDSVVTTIVARVVGIGVVSVSVVPVKAFFVTVIVNLQGSSSGRPGSGLVSVPCVGPRGSCLRRNCRTNRPEGRELWDGEAAHNRTWSRSDAGAELVKSFLGYAHERFKLVILFEIINGETSAHSCGSQRRRTSQGRDTMVRSSGVGIVHASDTYVCKKHLCHSGLVSSSTQTSCSFQNQDTE